MPFRSLIYYHQVSYKGYAANVDNGVEVVKYWPHRGEELPDEPPSPVLMVTKVDSCLRHQDCICAQVKTLDKEQHWVKNACEQIGLGSGKLSSKAGKVAALVNF